MRSNNTLQHALVRLIDRLFFGSAYLSPLQIGATFAVNQSFGNRLESSEVWKLFERGQFISSANDRKLIAFLLGSLLTSQAFS